MQIWEIARLAEEKDLKERKDRVLKVLNDLIKLCQPITYDEFNKKMEAIDSNKLYEYEQANPEAGLLNMGSADEPKTVKFGITTLSLIATVTDILIGDRLSFRISDDKEDLPKGTIMGVDWYYENLDKVKIKKSEQIVNREEKSDAV